jgi:hypothetical protein
MMNTKRWKMQPRAGKPNINTERTRNETTIKDWTSATDSRDRRTPSKSRMENEQQKPDGQSRQQKPV